MRMGRMGIWVGSPGEFVVGLSAAFCVCSIVVLSLGSFVGLLTVVRRTAWMLELRMRATAVPRQSCGGTGVLPPPADEPRSQAPGLSTRLCIRRCPWANEVWSSQVQVSPHLAALGQFDPQPEGDSLRAGGKAPQARFRTPLRGIATHSLTHSLSVFYGCSKMCIMIIKVVYCFL